MRKLLELVAVAGLAIITPAAAEPVAPVPGGVAWKSTDEIVRKRTDGSESRRLPALWRASRGGEADIYLFGTMHILPKGVSWRSPTLEAAMADAEVTALETDADSKAAQSEMARLVERHGVATDMALPQRLGPARWAEFVRRARDVGVDANDLRGVKPWLAIISVTMAAFGKEGFAGAHGVDDAIALDADAQADEFVFLEPLETQILAMASLDADGDLASFDVSLAELADFRSETEAMLEAWAQGDLPALERVALNDMKAIAPAAYRALFVDRNDAWLKRIEDFFAGSDDVFVAVGAAHLIGEDGLVEQLRAAGATVERLQ